jgi:hypothetical protein
MTTEHNHSIYVRSRSKWLADMYPPWWIWWQSTKNISLWLQINGIPQIWQTLTKLMDHEYKVKIGNRRYVHYMMNIEKNDVWWHWPLHRWYLHRKSNTPISVYASYMTGETWKWFFNKTNLSSHNTRKTRTNLNYNSNLTLIKILKILSVQWILLYLKPLTFTSLNMCVRRFNLIISSTKIYQNEIDALN